MENTQVRNSILVAEDEPEVRNFLRLALRSEGFEVAFAQDGEEVIQYLEAEAINPSLLLLDVFMPRKGGLETLDEVHRRQPHIPVLMISGGTTPTMVVDAMRRGANDFLAKPITHEQLRNAIRNLVSKASTTAPSTAAWCGKEPWSCIYSRFLESVPSTDVPVLVQGETGVGKEMLSRQIHSRSLRAHRPFLKLNCAALPSELVESELFGYDRGAFTGAFRNTPGKFELANGGTILLDEIGDMDVRLQAKLLQVLQDKEFIRLGSSECTRVDVRLIAATHRNLEEAIEAGQFREDLYYRLNVLNIVIPPLRERCEEILPLAECFLAKHARAGEPLPEIQPVLQDALLTHDWPGNIRELENVIRRFLVFRNCKFIADELAQKTRHRLKHHIGIMPSSAVPNQQVPKPGPTPVLQGTAGIPRIPPRSGVLTQVDEKRKREESEAILAALNQALWNRKLAAIALEIDYKALLYKMKKLGIGERKPA